MADLQIIEALKSLLQKPLPGWQAQSTLMPQGRGELSNTEVLHHAAVLIALYPDQGEWYFPLIVRSQDGFAHSGQVALPGGRREGSETDIETALREAEEEVHLLAKDVEILGLTSPLPIPVSRHLVQPVVGFMRTSPDLRPDPREVAHIFSVSLLNFRKADIMFETRHFQGRDWKIPHFDIDGHKVWGATAMILSEFRQLLLKII
ncbi:CoA pyrophosphatase [bacterium]|nr:CoA pyrophosphatase [bacterium]